MFRRPPRSTPFPTTTLFRSRAGRTAARGPGRPRAVVHSTGGGGAHGGGGGAAPGLAVRRAAHPVRHRGPDRKSTRLNSSHANISYAVFCLKKKPTVDAVVAP